MNSKTFCTDRRDIVESADKGVKVLDTRQFDFYFVSVAHLELVVLLSDSFTVVLIFCVEVSKTACRFSLTCVVTRFLYLDTDFVEILFLVPQCYLFSRRSFFAYFKSLIKISKSFKK